MANSMTNVKFYKNKQGHFVKYTISGHAGYDVHGNDIVCAAISVLGQTGVLSLKTVLNVDIGYTIEEGYLEVVIPSDLGQEKLKETNIVFETILIGIKSSMEAYPEYITLEYGEVR